MKTLTVDLDSRAYPIHIGEKLITAEHLLSPAIHGKDVFIVTNETVAPLYLDKLTSALTTYQVSTIALPDGEQYKTLSTVESIFDQLLDKRYARDATIIALGGGVVGDIAGFAAACYQRGIHFIQIPTTLLAQVDSSVGGKTGVNHPLGKNMIGAFHQPHCVIADTQTLNTLPIRELRAGIAEVIKYGLIAKSEFFTWLEANIEQVLALDTNALQYAINESCQCKAEVVAADELEQKGNRALLNLGHTFGHAIETGLGYGAWLHGEAVGCGMLIAAEFSARLNWINAQQVNRVRSLLERAGLPTKVPKSLGVERMLELMAVDKKVKDGKIRLVLLKDIGNAVLTDDFDLELLQQTLLACIDTD